MTGELVQRTIIPEVVDDSGRPVVGPELDAVLKRMTDLAQLAQLAKIRKILEKQEFEGKTDPRTLAVTDQAQYVDLIRDYPNTAWVKANFINQGANTIFLIINTDPVPVPILATGKVELDYQMADKRISLFSYWCSSGLASTLQAVGKY